MNYYSVLRSNYCEYTQPALARELLTKLGAQVFEGKDEGIAFGYSDGGWNNTMLVGDLIECSEELTKYMEPFTCLANGDVSDPPEYDIEAAICGLLKDGWALVIQEAGHEGMRYVNGWAMALNSKGEREVVNIDDITDKAKKLGEHVTACEY